MDRKKAGPESATPRPDSGPPAEALLKAALRLLSIRARSVKELTDRLQRKGFTPSDVSYCVGWLKERDHLNDEAFARSLLRDRLRFSPRSPFLLERELKDKGVAASLAGEVLEAVLEEEGASSERLSAEAARSWVRKQSPAMRADLVGDRFSPERERARRRLHGFLARRGFVGDAARRGLEAGEKEARRQRD